MTGYRLHSRFITQPKASAPGARRGGAVIILSLALLMTLLFLGLFFFAFINDESLSADAFASAKDYTYPSVDLMDFGLRQVIVATNSTDNTRPYYAPYSALAGSRWSLLAHVIGKLQGDGSLPTNGDTHVYSGRGIVIQNTGVGTFNVFFDGDTSTPSAFDETNFPLNFSAAANGTAIDVNDPSLPPPYDQFSRWEPDAGYTYPDLNSFFLCYEEFPLSGGMPIIKPSFFLPGYFPALRSSATTPTLFQGLYTSGATAGQVLRPHTGHGSRYVTAAAGIAAQSGDRSRRIFPMTFHVDFNGDNEDKNFNGVLDAGEDLNGNGVLDSHFDEMGVWDGTNNYDFDVDADRDGYADSILTDLDGPLIDYPDGRQLVPLYYWKIVDADALLSVNYAGNAPNTVTFTHPFGGEARMAQSNLGLSPSELNPTWALGIADPADPLYVDTADRPYVMTSYNARYGIPDDAYWQGGSTTETRFTAANMGLGMLQFGDGVVPGRWGDEPGATDGARAGTTGIDDDQDSETYVDNSLNTFPLQHPYGGHPYEDRMGFNRGDGFKLPIPGFVQPLDYVGRGSHLNASQPLLANLNAPAQYTDPKHPTRWPSYQGYQRQGINTDYAAAPYSNLYPNHLGWADASGLQTFFQGLVDEPDELVTEPGYTDPDDAPFTVDEMAALHLSDADWQRLGRSSRLKDLLSWQFRDNRLARLIRRQFTTHSSDRPEFAIEYDPTVTATRDRTWEFNDSNRFPPMVAAAGASRHETGAIVATDPFRPEIRRLLTVRPQDTSSNFQFPQRRLDLNRILADDSAVGGASNQGFDASGNPIYRPLVPHPEFLVSDAAYTGGPAFPELAHANDAVFGSTPGDIRFNFADIQTDKIAQEWWARYDRQRLARDIYVLLYFLGAPETDLAGTAAFNPTTTSYAAWPDTDGNGVPDIVQEMAQFAVNYVDALDRDNVITRFEYDPDLSNGWDTPTAAAYGIEAQSLTFSEVLALRTQDIGSDNNATYWNDDDPHNFLWIELRNASPFPVLLEEDSWRIVRVTTSAPDGRVEFKSTTKTVAAGGNFIIGGHDNSMLAAGQGEPTTLYVDYDTAQTGMEAVVPFSLENGNAALPPAAGAHPEPLCDIDLSYTGTNDHINEFTLTPKGTGTLVDDTDVATTEFDLILQRRPHLQGRTKIPQTDWVEVDRIHVGYSATTEFNGGATDLQAEINKFTSYECQEPFARLYDGANAFEPFHNSGNVSTTQYAPRYHTLGYPPALTDYDKDWANSVSPMATGFTTWQPHFDRDYASVIDLLAVPLCGQRVGDGSGTVTPPLDGGFILNLAENVSGFKMTGHRTAAIRMLYPAATLPAPFTAHQSLHYANRWHRLLDFVEVPSRAQDRIIERLGRLTHVPGKLNLNTLRHEEGLAGLLDDDTHLSLFSATGARTTDDLLDTGTRNWYDQLVASRDGIDTVSGTVEPPGTPLARPFRPLSYIAPYDSTAATQDADPNDSDNSLSLNNTLLRFATLNGQRMGLLEAQSTSDAASFNVDYYTRQRLLSKVANLTTNRSHVFVIWCGYQFHDAHLRSEDTNGNGTLDAGEDLNGNGTIDLYTQVGAKADDVPGHREFVVVDMSRLEEAYYSDDGGSSPAYFHFEPFIIHREILP